MAKTISVFKKVDPRILEDVGYVEKRWMRSLTEELKGAGFTWESLGQHGNEGWIGCFGEGSEVRIGRACKGDSG